MSRPEWPIFTKEMEAAYVHCGGTRCPWCDSSDIEGRKGVETDAGVAWQDIKCLDCGATWADSYALVGLLSDYRDTTVPQEESSKEPSDGIR